MLVGRDAERQRLDALLAAARLGQSGVLVVTGEAGIGKTALLDDLRSRASDIRVLTVTGSEAERDLPFAGLAQLLRLAPADLDRLPPPQADALGVALALWPGTGADRFAVGAGLLTLLAEQSEDQPLCLIVDDAHQLDQPSQDALLFVARRLVADPIALVIGVRSPEPCRLADPGLPQLALTGLAPGPARELARTAGVGLATGAEATGPVVELVLELSQGNPLAIRELVADPAAWAPAPTGLPTALPSRLTSAYARRFHELGPDAALAARCAAVVGGDLAVTARACAALGVPVDALADAESAGLLRVAAERVEFRHPLVRSALYSTADPGLRRRLHAVAASAVGPDDPDRRVWHLSASVLGPDEAVAAELEGSAQRAADRSAYAVAATAADRAATLSTDPAARVRRRLAAATWAWHGGGTDRARTLLTSTDLATGDPAVAVRHRIDHLIGVIAARDGAMDQARDRLVAAAAAAAEPDDALTSLSEAVDTCYYLGDAATAVRLADDMVALLPRAPGEAGARGSIAAGCARILAGRDGIALIRDGLARLSPDRAGTDPALATWAVVGLLFLRDADSGRDLMDQVVGARRARLAVGELPHLLFHIARDEAASDQWDRAEIDYGEARALARELGQSTELAASTAGLAWLEARRGQSGSCRQHAAEALALSQRHRLHLMEVWARWAEADLTLARGEIGGALSRYTEVARRLDELGIADVDLSPAPEIAECLIRLGRGADALAPASDYARQASAKGQPWAQARAGRALAGSVGDTEIDAAFRTALVHHDHTLDVFERSRTLLAYGSRLRRARRRLDARPVLQHAVEGFARLRADPWADAARDELAATGATVSRPGGSPRSLLTERELQIAVLLTEGGRTTRETAGALFLSPKTVEYHLRNVYTKLGVSSRRELAGLLGGTPTS